MLTVREFRGNRRRESSFFCDHELNYYHACFVKPKDILRVKTALVNCVLRHGYVICIVVNVVLTLLFWAFQVIRFGSICRHLIQKCHICLYSSCEVRVSACDGFCT
jgi:hypothetical protein